MWSFRFTIFLAVALAKEGFGQKCGGGGLALTPALYKQGYSAYKDIVCIPMWAFCQRGGNGWDDCEGGRTHTGDFKLDGTFNKLVSVAGNAFYYFAGKIEFIGSFPALRSVGFDAFMQTGTADSFVNFNTASSLEYVGSNAFYDFKGKISLVGAYPGLTGFSNYAFEESGTTDSVIKIECRGSSWSSGKDVFKGFKGEYDDTGEKILCTDTTPAITTSTTTTTATTTSTATFSTTTTTSITTTSITTTSITTATITTITSTTSTLTSTATITTTTTTSGTSTTATTTTFSSSSTTASSTTVTTTTVVTSFNTTEEEKQEIPPETIAVVIVLVGGTSILTSLILVNNFIPKGPCIKYVLEKLGLLWCFEIDYPIEADPEKRKVEILSTIYRKSAEKCECTAVVCGVCTLHGPTATNPQNDDVDPSTALFDPMTKLYRWLGLPGIEHGCGQWCTVHGPNPNDSNNILFDPSAAIMNKCCGDLKCCTDESKLLAIVHKTQIEFVDMQPKENPLFADGETQNAADATETANGYIEVVGSTATGTRATFKNADIGKRVTVQGYGGVKGTIRFVGKHVVEKTLRVGVELDKPVGKSNGTVKGHPYFECSPKHGILIKPGKVTLVKKKRKKKAAP